MARIVQKYGGASLSETKKINAIAQRILKQKQTGDEIVVVVSAIGRTTDGLLAQAKEICSQPDLRELDVILNTGELVSSAMLSMALIHLGCPARSFNGSQAGISTDQTFSNARIRDIDSRGIERALRDGEVAVIAGFQGMTDEGSLTTLGRGGSDTSAVAIAATLGADRCEILKDVPAIFSANPNLVPDAFPLHEIDYETLLDMTFWGAKVLNYRSVEIGHFFSVPLYVGPAHSQQEGTLIKKELCMLEGSKIISLNSHEIVLNLKVPENTLPKALTWLNRFLDQYKIPQPQILHSTIGPEETNIFLTGPKEVLLAIAEQSPSSETRSDILSSVTATCMGSTSLDLMEKIANSLEDQNIKVKSLYIGPRSISVFIAQSMHENALKALHQLIKRPLPPHFVPRNN